MSTLDLDVILAGVSVENPCGEDLAYDADAVALFDLAAGTPERQIGDVVVPAEEPNWGEVKNKATALLGRTLDLRVGMQVLASLIETEGFEGLRIGVALIRGMVTQHWDGVHPKLDPEDNNDPTERMNIVASLAAPPDAFGDDSMRIQARIRACPFTASASLGRYGLRDLQLASGEISTQADEESPSISTIKAALADTPAEQLQHSLQCLQEAIEGVDEIDRTLTERVGAGNAPDLSAFQKLLETIAEHIRSGLGERGYSADLGGEADGELPADSAGGAAAIAAPTAPTGAIQSRQDVLDALDRICAYYVSSEPSSPVPVLLVRARRLVTMSFVDIVRDLTPDAVGQIELLAGDRSVADEDS
ncbi:MAG: type VI secretion system protein TssA [Phycisphaera sp.]|nr:MAG: type VI secretion system protein TssA [Phycisphaera sp.]